MAHRKPIESPSQSIEHRGSGRYADVLRRNLAKFKFHRDANLGPSGATQGNVDVTAWLSEEWDTGGQANRRLRAADDPRPFQGVQHCPVAVQ